MYGIEEFAAVNNPPHATILAVGAGEERAVVRDHKIVAATQMKITLSTDHRAVDGALGDAPRRSRAPPSKGLTARQAWWAGTNRPAKRRRSWIRYARP